MPDPIPAEQERPHWDCPWCGAGFTAKRMVDPRYESVIRHHEDTCDDRPDE